MMHNVFKFTAASESLKTAFETSIISCDLSKTNTDFRLIYMWYISNIDHKQIPSTRKK